MNERFKVDLRGIIDLAANHLYSSPDVFVREVIQNAIDAITARASIQPDYSGAVRLELTSRDDGSGTICVTDNGIGLSTEEVHQFLSTVGGSSKREDAQAVADNIESGGSGFLGRFGIGLLSCFMITDEIVVVTRSARAPNAPAVEWRGRADGSYAVRELPDSKIAAGTSVYLDSKPVAAEYFERERLIDLARRYAEMLLTPIVVVVGQDEVSVNRPVSPWNLNPESEIELADACQSLLGFRPLDSFPVHLPESGVRGYAFIRSDRTTGWSQANRLYSHGMFVSEHVHGLMPHWATFVGSILNTDKLKLTASRESIHHDSMLTQTEEDLGRAIRKRLATLLRSDRRRFEEIMLVHDTEIRGLAVKDQEFFDLIIDLLEFETSLGIIRFGEFRREHETLLVCRTSEQFRRLSPIAAAGGIRVFNGGYTYHEELLSRAVARYPQLRLQAFDSSDLAETLNPPSHAADFEVLRAIANETLEGRDCEVVIREFKPTETAAFYAIGLGAEFHKQLDRTKSMASGLWNEILDAMAPRLQESLPTRLCLNSSNPLIQALASLPNKEACKTGIEVLYVQSLMDGQHVLTAEDLALLQNGMKTMLAGFSAREGGR